MFLSSKENKNLAETQRRREKMETKKLCVSASLREAFCVLFAIR